MNNYKEKVQLFILPYAGGTALAFNELICRIDANINVVVIEYPGHGKRKSEPYAQNFEKLLNDVEYQINSQINLECKIAIFGYSMGGIIGYELVRNKRVLKSPYILFIAAQEDPSYNSFKNKVVDWSEKGLVNYTISLGGVDKCLLDNPRFLLAFMEPIKRDYILRAEYKFDSQKGKVTCDTIILYSCDDTPIESVKGWKNKVQANVRFIEFKGNHFFLKQYIDKVAGIINHFLGK